MANFVDINVEVDNWNFFFLEIPKEAYNPDYTFTIKIDESFLQEYRKALKVVERFQTYVDKEVRKQLDERKR